MENANEFLGLTQNKRKGNLSGRPTLPFDEPGPPACFAQFFQTDFQLVNEIIARFSILSLTVVGIGRCPRTKNLPCNMIAGSGGW